MCSAISPKSEATVLLWGNRWWLPHHRLPVPFTDLFRAADVLASVWTAPNRAIRLIYQPDHLVTVATACPKTNRATLVLALGEEFPVLCHPAFVWSHEPILPEGESYATLLHFETEPALHALVQQLEARGFTVNSAWPLAAWLTALPPDLSDSGAMTAAAFCADRFCVHRHAPNGTRRVVVGVGLDELVQALRPTVEENAAEFLLYVATEEAMVSAVEEKIRLGGNQVVGVFALADALAKAAPLSAENPAQLLQAWPKVVSCAR